MSISVLLEVVRCKCSKRTPVNNGLSDFTGHENDTILKEEEQNICEGPLTETERLAALKTMETEKTPGWDGSVPAEFYKVFWNDIIMQKAHSMMQGIFPLTGEEAL